MGMPNTFGIVRQLHSLNAERCVHFLLFASRLSNKFVWKMSRKVYEMWFELMELLSACARLALSVIPEPNTLRFASVLLFSLEMREHRPVSPFENDLNRFSCLGKCQAPFISISSPFAINLSDMDSIFKLVLRLKFLFVSTEQYSVNWNSWMARQSLLWIIDGIKCSFRWNASFSTSVYDFRSFSSFFVTVVGCCISKAIDRSSLVSH